MSHPRAVETRSPNPDKKPDESAGLRANLDRLSELLRGRFLAFEGPDGAGKSTQLKRLARAMSERGLPIRDVRDPGGTHAGELIRKILLEPSTGEIAVRCEMLLFMASRAQLCAEIIAPSLAAGELVLADRFVSSTVAYQGKGGGAAVWSPERGLEDEDILRVGRVATGGVWPELVVVFDVDAKTAASRLNPLLDRMEARGEAFHAAVRESYRRQAAADPDGHLLIDARSGSDEVFEVLVSQLVARLGRHA